MRDNETNQYWEVFYEITDPKCPHDKRQREAEEMLEIKEK